MVGVENEQNIHCMGKDWVDLVLITDFEHHVEEVFAIRQSIVWRHEGEALAEAVTHGGNGWDFCNKSHYLLIERVCIEDVFCVVVESSECCYRRNEHAHWVSVVVEAIYKSLTHVFVNHGVMCDIKFPFLKFLRCWQFTLD